MAGERRTRSDKIFDDDVLDTAEEIYDQTNLTWPEVCAVLPEVADVDEVNRSTLVSKISARRHEHGDTWQRKQGPKDDTVSRADSYLVKSGKAPHHPA